MTATAPGTPELMVAALAREIADTDVLGVGLGTVLALLATLTARRGHAPNAEFTCGGALSPEVGLLDALRGPDGMEGRTGAWISHLDTMEIAERQRFTLMFLRPAQIDSRANLNVSAVGETRLPGGVGTADTLSLLPRVVCYHTDHRLRSLPAQVDFITGPGAGRSDGAVVAAGVVTLVTDRCVIDYSGGRPVVRSIHPGQTAESVQAATGFALPDLERAPVTEAPAPALLEAIEALDPLRLRDLEFRATREAAEVALANALDSRRHPSQPTPAHTT